MPGRRVAPWLDSAARVARLVGSNPAQVVVTIAIAALLAAATWTTSLATSAWQSSTRDETKATTLALEQVRHVYHDDAPTGFGVALLFVRAGALEGRGRLAEIEAATARKAAGELRLALRRTDSVMQQRYELDDHGYALNRRLGDLLGSDAAADRAAVAASVDEGDRLAGTARLLTAIAVLMSLLFIAIRLLGLRSTRGTRRCWKRRRRGPAEPDVGLVPQPWTEAPHLKLASVVALSAWVLLPALTTIQLVLSAQSASADAETSGPTHCPRCARSSPTGRIGARRRGCGSCTSGRAVSARLRITSMPSSATGRRR